MVVVQGGRMRPREPRGLPLVFPGEQLGVWLVQEKWGYLGPAFQDPHLGHCGG